ncbi:MAG: LysM peptidoglycan-binding domain-containing protein [Aquabacterium sp.]|jgi:nucleoid-associated protein YgaU|nr:MAG: LysM peptidoglycan-binding domain-containing protein [Aquabacterium sp.]
MALEKLTILVERSGSTMQFGDDRKIVAAFNPGHLKFSRQANWKSQGAALRDVPELQFTGAQPRTLDVDLLFDTYDDDTAPGSKAKVTDLTDPVLKLTTVESHGDKHRPPVCRLRWGSAGVFFQGVLERLNQDFTLFMENGTPVRARLSCSFKEWRTNYEDLNRQNTQSSDVAKAWVVKRGQTLASIAADEYQDPACWRVIARANGIDDPLSLQPGRTLLLPALGPDDGELRR